MIEFYIAKTFSHYLIGMLICNYIVLLLYIFTKRGLDLNVRFNITAIHENYILLEAKDDKQLLEIIINNDAMLYELHDEMNTSFEKNKVKNNLISQIEQLIDNKICQPDTTPEIMKLIDILESL